MLKQLGGALLIASLGAGAMYAFGPERSAEVPAPPETKTTVIVPSYVLGAMQEEMFDMPEVVTTDRRNQTDTVWRTPERVVQHVDTVVDSIPGSVDTVIRWVTLPGRWFLDTLDAPTEAGDSALYSLTWLEGQAGGGVLREDALMRHPAPPGPLEYVATDSAGLHVEYADQWPGNDEGPGFLIQKIPASVACGAEAAYVGSVEAYLACETGSFAQLGVSALVRWLR